MDRLIKQSDWLPVDGLPEQLTLWLAKSTSSKYSIRNSYSYYSQVTSQLFFFILILSVLADSVLARPAMNSHSQNRSKGRSRKSHQPKPKWVNPCGIDPKTIRQLHQHHAYFYHDVTPLSDNELIQNILLSAKNALVHSDDFKEKFVRRTFSTPSWRDHHDTWKEQRYNWLPSWKEIPKHLHESLEAGHLQKLSLDTALQKIYNYLQRFAVGLEEVVMDQAVFNGDFLMEFNEAEYKLKAVLCELQMAMLERDIEFGEDISREIMKHDVRDIQDQSYRNLRDWYIYRDYMNGLEYIIHAFDYLQKSKSHH